MIDDLMDEPDYDEVDDRAADCPERDAGMICKCGHETAGESCGFCGEPLCPACFEMGAGFCDKPHTDDQIDSYEHDVYGTPWEELKARRATRNSLKSLGIFP